MTRRTRTPAWALAGLLLLAPACVASLSTGCLGGAVLGCSPGRTGTTATPHVSTRNLGLTQPHASEGPFVIARVVDGDTAKIALRGRTVTLRMIGIDTPETRDPRKPEQCFGWEASTRAKDLLLGKRVWIEYDPSQARRDRYGRELVYVWLAEHTMFNELMVREGFAREYTHQQVPYRYQSQFRVDERKARAAALGRWNPRSCSGRTTPRT